MAIPNNANTRNEQYLAAIAGVSGTLPDEPITRKEFYLAKAAGQDVETPTPITREEMYLDAIARGGGGGGDITLTTLNVSANGTTNAPSGTAYNKVVANVSNSYAAGDEGKVVQNGALVSQTSNTATSNGTVDTTLINSLTVDVPTKDYEAADWLNFSKPTGAIVSSVLFTSVAANLDAIKNHTGITSIRLTESVNVPGSFAYGCTALQTFVGTKVNNTAAAPFYGCTSLTAIDILGGGNLSGDLCRGSGNCNVLVLRSTSLTSISNTTTFRGSVWASGGAGGTIYIPKVLYDHLGDGSASDYKAATNWSTVDGYGTITWAKIEGSIYETQYADGTPIS